MFFSPPGDGWEGRKQFPQKTLSRLLLALLSQAGPLPAGPWPKGKFCNLWGIWEIGGTVFHRQFGSVALGGGHVLPLASLEIAVGKAARHHLHFYLLIHFFQ